MGLSGYTEDELRNELEKRVKDKELKQRLFNKIIPSHDHSIDLDKLYELGYKATVNIIYENYDDNMDLFAKIYEVVIDSVYAGDLKKDLDNMRKLRGDS